MGVVIPFVPRNARSADGPSGGPGGAQPNRWPAPPPSAPPAGAPRQPAAFPRPPRRGFTRSWSSLPRGARFALVAGVAAVLLLGAGWMRCGWAGCPDVAALGAFQPGGAPVVLDRNGRPFAELAPVEGERVRLKDLPRHVPDAFIAVEDRRFRGHRGVDWVRVPGAMLANVRSQSVQEGFSTITMQLARNVFPDRLPGKERTLTRKVLEIRVANDIERRFDKDEILELYLNHIYFGNGAHGIEAAARHYFGKPASRLTLPEAATLAAMPKAPTSYDPRRHRDKALERRNLVLALMEKQGLLQPGQAQQARAQPLRVRRARRVDGGHGLAAYFVEQVQREAEERLGSALYHQPWRLHTTLDARVQKAAEEELARQLTYIESGALGRPGPVRSNAGAPGSGRLQGAVVVLDAATGDVLAWVGGRDFGESRFDRVRDGRRQAGSAFKPFVYATAVAGGVPLNGMLEDQPLRVRLGGRQVWEPKNFEGTFDGHVTVRDALVRSKNVPTIRLAESVGIDRVANLAERAGVEPPIPREPSMPLGTVAVSPLELAAAYTAFARLGPAARPRTVARVEGPNKETVWETEPQTADVLDPATAYLINDVLGEALLRGTGTAVRDAGFRAPAAGKTGTTNDGADAWFVGYTPDVVAAVWIGYDHPRMIVPRATGGRLAAPVWARLMLRLYEGRRAPAGWARPEGVVEGWVDPSTGQRLAAGCRPAYGAARRELFLAAHVPREGCPASGQPEVLTADMLPLEGYEEYLTDPDLPPLELERTPVPAEEDVDPAAEPAEAGPPVDAAAPPVASPTPSSAPDLTPGARRPGSPRPTGSPAAVVTPAPAPTPRPAATPRPEEPAEEEEAEEPAPAPAPTPTPPSGGSGIPSA